MSGGVRERFQRDRLMGWLLAATVMLFATPVNSQQPGIAEAKAFLKDMLLSQDMGLPMNGSVNISEVDFDNGCIMGLSAQNRFFMVAVDFRKANFRESGYNIIIERGVTVFRGKVMIQPKDSSTIGLRMFSTDLTPRVMNAITVIHNACYAGNGYSF